MHLGSDEAELLEKLHEMEMAGQPGASSMARLLKEIMPVLMRWLHDERERGSTPVDVFGASVQASSNVLLTVALNMADEDDALDGLVDLAAASVSESLRIKKESAKKMLREQKESDRE